MKVCGVRYYGVVMMSLSLIGAFCCARNKESIFMFPPDY